MPSNKHEAAPILEAIAEYHKRGTLPFTIPGHKCGRGVDQFTIAHLGFETFHNDVPMLGGLDDRSESKDIRHKAEKLAGDAFGADDCYFSVNGSSLSAHVCMVTVAEPGDTVAVVRNAHKSLIDAAVFAGTHCVFLENVVDKEQNIEHGVEPEEVTRVLDKYPQTKAVFIVSPTYFGVTSDIKAIADICHKRKVALVVDEAWGAHFPFSNKMPDSGIALGADLVFVSVHKTMGALQQGSMVMIKSDLVDGKRLKRALKMFESTSPSSLILGSLDGMRRMMVLEGEELWGRAVQLADTVRKEVAKVPGIKVLGPNWKGKPGCVDLDPTRLVFDVSDAGLTGYDAADWLSEKEKVESELADERRIIGILSLSDDEKSIENYIAAIKRMADEAPKSKAAPMQLPSLLEVGGEWTMNPGKAWFGKTIEVSAKEAVGQIAGELVTPYPPGIPRVRPGEVITQAAVDYLQQGLAAGMYVSDADDTKVKKITIVDTTPRK
jgi:arginine decarboxylase